MNDKSFNEQYSITNTNTKGQLALPLSIFIFF